MFYINGKTINKNKQIEYMKAEERKLFEQAGIKNDTKQINVHNDIKNDVFDDDDDFEFYNEETGELEKPDKKDTNKQQEKTQEQKVQAVNWEDPEQIEQQLLPVQTLPDEAIPTPFKGWIYDVSQRMSVPLDFPFVATIITASSIIGTGATVRPKKYDDWTVIPNLWGGIIADPSKKKSGVLNEIINKSIGRLEVKARDVYTQHKKDFDIDSFISKSIHEGKEKEIKDAIKKEKDTEKQTALIQKLKKDIQDLQQKTITEPTERRYKVNDCTIEKYIELNKENPRGLLYFRDELIGFFKRLDKQGNEPDRALVMEAWNGQGNYTQDRVGRGTVRADNLCMSLIGGIQPDKIIGYLKDAMEGGNDGFVQRLQLMVYPDTETNEFIDRYPDTEAKNNFYRIIEKLAAMNENDFIDAGATMPEGEKFPCFRFDDESYKLYKKWWYQLNAKIEDPDEHTIIKEHLSKYQSLMPSLALIYHLIEIADKGYSEYHGKYINGGDITEHCTRQAIACTDYLETHARRIYATAIKSADTLAIALSNKILNQKLKTPFTARDVYIKEWSLLDTPEAAETAIKKLLKLNWLHQDKVKNGKKTFDQYHINPKVFNFNTSTFSTVTLLQKTD